MKKHLVTLLLCAFTLSSFAQAGTAVFSGMNVFGSARVAAIGGNAIALCTSDINTAAINPALIDSLMNRKLAMSYVRYFGQSNFGYTSFGFHPAKSKFAFAGTLQYFGYGESARLDGLGNDLGTFSSNEYALTIGASYKVDSLWRVGLNLKNLYSVFDSFYSYGVAIDAAATYYQPRTNFAASFVLKNVGMQLVTYRESSREKLPLEFQIAISKRPKNAPFLFHIAYENAQKWNVKYTDPNATVIVDPLTGLPVEDRTWQFGDQLMRHIVVGTEIILGNNVRIGLGYNYRQRKELSIPNRPATAGLSLGTTINFKKFQLSFGRSIYHVAGGSNHLTFTTQL
ncbi:MAG: type secretion system protein PorQ [Bacteroidota bacterium]